MFKKAVLAFICLVLTIQYLPTQTAAVTNAAPELSCKAAILIEASSGEVLYEKNPDEPLPMASVTKIMTMLLIMESIEKGELKMDEMVVGSERAKSMGGSTIYLDAGESLSVHDMLKGIAVASANDACVAMAEHIAGSEAAFVERMNAKAAELGMSNTVFKNTNGLDAEGHYSSARDIALMSAELLKYPKIKEYTTIWMDSLRDGKFELANTNKLIRFYKGANGLKTGSTSKALYCLSGTAERDNMQLIAVIMAAPSSPKRFSDASKLLDYGFASYNMKTVIHKGEMYSDVLIKKGQTERVTAVSASEYKCLLSNGQQTDINTEVEICEDISAPVEKGARLGEIHIIKNDELIGKVDLIAAYSVEKLSYINMLSGLFVRLASVMI